MIVLLQADCGFWFSASRVPGWQGLKGMKVDIIKPQVVRFVFPVAHDVIVPAGRPTRTISSSLRNSSAPKVAKNCTFQHSIQELSAMAGAALDFEELFPIELLECGTTPAGAPDHEELLVVELLEFGTNPAGALKVKVTNPSCKRVASKVRRVDCVTNAPVPQGTTASTTPPFVWAGYDCRNNTTVRRRPEAVGWAPLV